MSCKECEHHKRRPDLDEQTPLLRPTATIVSRSVSGSSAGTKYDSYNSTVASSSSSTLEPTSDDERNVNDDDGDAPKKETPLDWWQFSLILFLQLAEALTSQVINPFVPQLIKDVGITDGDDTKVGYYVGLMQSIFFAAQGLTVLHWARASDRFGRKPIILIGFLGLAISMYSFGLSRTFTGIVASRALNGALNGNVGVVKSIMGELTDETNIARAFAWQPLPWSMGSTFGPLIGGALAHPAERFPSVFGSSEFLRKYPYFLPCAVPATFTVFCWFIAYFYLKETNPQSTSLFRSKSSPSQPLTPSQRTTPPLRTILTPRITLSISCYALLCLLEIAFRAIQPVFYASPAHLGGLGLAPHQIGGWLALVGAASGLFQTAAFPRLCALFGVRGVYLLGLGCAAPIFALFPVMSVLVARRAAAAELADMQTAEWYTNALMALLALQLALTLLWSVCYSAAFIYITASSPRSTLGAVNGLAQTSVSVARCVGPALASALFSKALKWEYEDGRGRAWGWSVYGVMLVWVLGALGVGRRLPGRPWRREEVEAEWEARECRTT